MKLKTDVDLAEILGITVEDVRLKCRGQWPCVKPKRGIWRFTDAQVEAIVEMTSVAPAARRPTAVSTQTRRSAARSA